jgi:hypothetical protein
MKIKCKRLALEMIRKEKRSRSIRARRSSSEDFVEGAINLKGLRTI